MIEFKPREAKFRAWDAENKVWAFEGFHVIGEVTLFNAVEGYQLEKLVKLIVTESTGDVDMYGKEVYEGDIVKTTIPDYENDNWKDAISYIKYDSHGFWVADEFFGWEGEGLWNWKLMEVIGNVFENPELLESEKS